MRIRPIILAVAAAFALIAAAAGLPPPAAGADRDPDWSVFRPHLDKSPEVVARAMLAIANVGPGDIVYDLGSGDGVIVVTAAKEYGARALGVEMNPAMVERAKANAAKAGVADKTTFVEGDLFKTDLKPATVITMFLWRSMNLRLRPQLLELAPGTRVVSHLHDMGEWRADRVKYVYHWRWGRRPVFLWVVPARIGGSWRLKADGRELDLRVEQTFQQFHGTVSAGGAQRTARLRNGRISGAAVSFDLAVAGGASKRYTGTMTGDGALEGPGWSARRAM
jgi:SAM-dependent methyltransferase